MIDPDGPPSLSRQSVLLGVSESSLYCRTKGDGAENLPLMRRMVRQPDVYATPPGPRHRRLATPGSRSESASSFHVAPSA